MTRRLGRLVATLVLGPPCDVCGTRCRRRRTDLHTWWNHPGEQPTDHGRAA